MENVLRKTKKAPDKKAMPRNSHKVNSNKLNLLVTIVDKAKGEFYSDGIQAFECNMQLMLRGKGTAGKHVLELLGLVDNEKSVIFSIVKEERLPEILAFLDEKFKTIKNGKGIAYTVPLTSIIGTAIFGFLSNNKLTVKGE
jgi:hypothetical protein